MSSSSGYPDRSPLPMANCSARRWHSFSSGALIRPGPLHLGEVEPVDVRRDCVTESSGRMLRQSAIRVADLLANGYVVVAVAKMPPRLEW